MYREQIYEKLRPYAYYIVIAILTLISTCFLPMIGSSADVNFQFPTTWDGWLVFFGGRIIISFINITIFYCFISQAEVNAQKDENYIKANELLNRINVKKRRPPRDPKVYIKNQWIKKGTMLFISSIGATFVFSNIILRFDLTMLLVYSFTILVAVITGWLTMEKIQYYWTHEYLDYAELQYEKETENDKKTI